MLPATGTFAALGTAIENGFKLYVAEQGGKVAGREIEYFKVDDESDPAKASRRRRVGSSPYPVPASMYIVATTLLPDSRMRSRWSKFGR